MQDVKSPIVIEPTIFLDATKVIDLVRQNGQKIDYTKANCCADSIMTLCPSERVPYAQNGPVREAVRAAVCSTYNCAEGRMSDLFVFQTMRRFARELRTIKQIKRTPNSGAKLIEMYKLGQQLHYRMLEAKRLLAE